MLYDATVIGLGPSGTVAAHRAAHRGLTVLGIDPTGPNAPSTVGAWLDQIPHWFPPDAIASEFFPSVITAEGTRRLDSRYVMLAPGWEKLLGNFPVRYELAAQSAAQTTTHTLVSVPQATLSARQVAFGVVIATEDNLEAVLMDFSPLPGFSDSPATFSYRVPLGGGLWLIEETIVASTAKPQELLPLLESKCAARRTALGITDPVIRSETVVFPLGPRRVPLDRGDGTVHIGGAGGWMHPATGYSVGAVLAGTDTMLDRILDGKAPVSLAWHVNYVLLRRGLAVLLALSPTQTRTFFSVVLALDEEDLRAYLYGTNPIRTAQVMLKIFLRITKKAPSVAVAVLRAFPLKIPS